MCLRWTAKMTAQLLAEMIAHATKMTAHATKMIAHATKMSEQMFS